uniref:Uncharacterized protein n=1 Tax=Kryptolebias marmoratus TaxID=37003 RepID=A0A3Q3AQH4_KRYMA
MERGTAQKVMMKSFVLPRVHLKVKLESSVAPAPESQTKVLKCRFGSRLCKDRTACVPLSHICDGERDCQDGSDEEGCGEYSSSDCFRMVINVNDHFVAYLNFGVSRCYGTGCVLLSHVCDGERDCPDGSDEEACGIYPDVDNHFLLICVWKKLYRLGLSVFLDDAENAPGASVQNEYLTEPPAPTEESTRPPTTPPCTSPSVLCPGSSICIKPTQMCDGRTDCPDGFDEKCVKRCPSQSE